MCVKSEKKYELSENFFGTTNQHKLTIKINKICLRFFNRQLNN